MESSPRNVAPERGAGPVSKFLDALKRHECHWRVAGRGWQANCPAHEDRAPSLSLREAQDGRLLLHCHAGCEPRAVLAALGLTFTDLFPARDSGVRKGGSAR